MEIFRFIFAFLIAYLPVLFSRNISFSTRDWYSALIKPEFSPPPWLFGIVWSILYFFIGLSLYIFFISKGEFTQKKFGYIFFTLQMFLNISYIPVCFGMKSLLGGLIITVLLSIFLVGTVIEFAKVSYVAACLLLPYLFWSLFAIILSYKVYSLN